MRMGDAHQNMGVAQTELVSFEEIEGKRPILRDAGYSRRIPKRALSHESCCTLISPQLEKKKVVLRTRLGILNKLAKIRHLVSTSHWRTTFIPTKETNTGIFIPQSRDDDALDNWIKQTTTDGFLQLIGCNRFCSAHVHCFGRVNRLLAFPTRTSSAWLKPKPR